MNNLNLIDDYLANRMNDAEKNAFESRLNADPELKQEFIFHKDIVNSIVEERKNQLKSMLNSIPVSPSSGSSLGNVFKVIGTVAGIGAIITGVYFFTQDEKTTPPETSQSEEQAPVISKGFEPADTEMEPDDQQEVEKPVEPMDKAEETEEEVESLTPAPPISQDRKPAEIKSPNVIDDFEDDNNADDINEPEVFTETEDLVTEELFDSNIEVIIDDSKKKFDFHYQYKDEKLYLFGAFDKGLYEILEFNNDEGKTIILYYKENYYHINDKQQEIMPLKPIEDTSFTDKLDRLRE